jgi:hypothetical protein
VCKFAAPKELDAGPMCDPKSLLWKQICICEYENPHDRSRLRPREQVEQSGRRFYISRLNLSLQGASKSEDGRGPVREEN